MVSSLRTAHRRVARTTLVALSAAAFLVACGEKKEADKPASQTAAKVNKEEITVHQINAALQGQRGLTPEQAEAASKNALERLIEQELAVQKAGELKIDREARVVQQIDAARREIIARAYVQKVSEGASKPTAEEIKKYYDENPNLFSARRLYQLQEIVVEADPPVVEQVKAKVSAAKNTGEIVEYLKAQNIRHSVNAAARGAEQLPMAALSTFAAMKDGEVRMTPTPRGLQIVALLASRSQPVSLEGATPAIEAFLLNERRRKIIADDLKALRSAASIQYVGKFAAPEGGASAPAAAPVPAAAPAPAPVLQAPSAPASGAVDAATISKGLGLK